MSSRKIFLNQTAPEAKNMAVEPIDEDLYFEENSYITVKVSEFSNDSIHSPGRAAVEYAANERGLRPAYRLTVYANGNKYYNKDWISLLFECHSNFISLLSNFFRLTLFVGVIDTSGNKKFSRSFSFLPDDVTAVESTGGITFSIEQYIRRKALLSEPLDYLVKDSMTLHIYLHFKSLLSAISVFPPNNDVRSSFKFTDLGNKYFLLLDSMVGEKLREESAFFNLIYKTPMMEGSTRIMKIPLDEYPTFLHIGAICMGVTPILVTSVDDICQMYAVADKYDIPIVIKISRSLLISFLRSKRNDVIAKRDAWDIQRIVEFAEKYEGSRLKEIIQNLLRTEEANVEGNNLADEDIDVETEWQVECFPSRQFLKCFKGASQYKKNSDYDFYR